MRIAILGSVAQGKAPGRVWAMHGVIEEVDRQRFAHRNLLETEAVRQHLRSRSAYVSLADALAGNGDALTIDDATCAGADAALLARQHGHAVTLFVNPGQVESREPYHFLVLNTALDALSDERCTFEGTTYPTATTAERQALRRTIKSRLATIKEERGRLEFVRALGREWGVHDLRVPAHFETLSRDDLIELCSAGVDLQNHGWSHSHHPNLTPSESLREIHEGRRWLERELNLQAPYFAVPFGDALPHGPTSEACDVWFSVDHRMPRGAYPPNVFNREELAIDAGRPSAEDGSPWPAAASSGLVTRLSRWVRAH